MADETNETNDIEQEIEAKPTITIAEKQSEPARDEKPTITIAEKQSGE
jgi:hypothetical protein